MLPLTPYPAGAEAAAGTAVVLKVMVWPLTVMVEPSVKPVLALIVRPPVVAVPPAGPYSAVVPAITGVVAVLSFVGAPVNAPELPPIVVLEVTGVVPPKAPLKITLLLAV